MIWNFMVNLLRSDPADRDAEKFYERALETSGITVTLLLDRSSMMIVTVDVMLTVDHTYTE
jgi:hypothetical protein